MTRARRVLLVVAASVLAATLIAAGVAALLAAPLDRTVVTHWGIDGQPDGWGPAWTWPALVGGIGLFLTILLVVFALIPYPAVRGRRTVPPIGLRPGEVAAWSGTVLMPRWLIGLMIAIAALIAGFGILEVVVAGPLADRKSTRLNSSHT